MSITKLAYFYNFNEPLFLDGPRENVITLINIYYQMCCCLAMLRRRICYCIIMLMLLDQNIIILVIRIEYVNNNIKLQHWYTIHHIMSINSSFLIPTVVLFEYLDLGYKIIENYLILFVCNKSRFPIYIGVSKTILFMLVVWRAWIWCPNLHYVAPKSSTTYFLILSIDNFNWYIICRLIVITFKSLN